MDIRTAEIILNEKTFIIKEKKIKELKQLFSDVIGGAVGDMDKLFKSDLPSDAYSAIGGMLTSVASDKLALIIPGLTLDDLENAYPSQIETAVKAFIDVNFTGVKGLGAPLLKLLALAPGMLPTSSPAMTTTSTL
jgi:hypothetical protein